MMMTRQAAIERFGVHYSASAGQHAITIYEHLGPKSLGYGHEKHADAVAEGRERWLQSLGRQVMSDNAARRQLHNRISILKSRLGFGARRAKVLAAVAEYDARAALLEARKANPEEIPLQTLELKEELRIPHLLDIGRSIWVVDFHFPLWKGIFLREYRISQVSIWPARDSAVTRSYGYDFRFDYTAVPAGAEESRSISFEYQRPNEQKPEVDRAANVIYSDAIFITREAAAECLREKAREMRSRASEAEARI